MQNLNQKVLQMAQASTSKDIAVETIEETDPPSGFDHDTRPIMVLLKRLIRNKQNTVMTNTQIIEILTKEFDIDIRKCHELEVDIYIKIVKKYLKDWPQWEELERISSKLCTAKDFDAVTKVLDHKYKNLKEYLGVMLEASKPLAKKAVADLETDANKDKNLESSEVALEIYCTRDQLNHLIFRSPRTDLNNTIFNVDKIEPTRISLNTLSFESILNFWWTKISINLPNAVIHRDVNYKYKHTLINKTKDYQLPVEVLDTRLYHRCRKARELPRKNILHCLDKILKSCQNEHLHQLLKVIFHIIRTDMEVLPTMLKVPSSYRRYANGYKYIRHLYVENEQNSDPKYDLQLEEMVAPSYQLFFGKLGRQDVNFGYIHEWLKIECLMCKVKFQGSTEMMSVVQAHYNDYHQHEPDWQCPHCKRLFSVDYLSKNRWQHEC